MSMKVKISFVDEGVSCEADFWPDKAPKTCQMLWEALGQSPFEGMCIHAMFTGRELSFPVEHTRLDPEISLNLPPENQIVFPIPGDLVWNAYHPYQWQGVPNPVYDFGIFYGRDARLLLPVGWRPSTLFGHIEENLAEFAAVAARCQGEGRKRVKVERLG